MGSILKERVMTIKIQPMSDLHLEFERELVPSQWFQPPDIGAQVLVLAGDIHLGEKAVPWVVRLLHRYNYILEIPGNHSYYRGNFDKLNDRWNFMEQEINEQARKNGAKGKYIHLDKKELIYDGVRFLGATLWTDMKNYDPIIAQAIQSGLNDYHAITRVIDGHYRKLRPIDTVIQHKKDREFLETKLNESKKYRKTVVVTHHAPSWQSVAECYKTDILSYAYATDLPDLLEKADYWFHGHTHTPFDYSENGCHVICNPRGYEPYEKTGYNPNLIIEV